MRTIGEPSICTDRSGTCFVRLIQASWRESLYWKEARRRRPTRRRRSIRIDMRRVLIPSDQRDWVINFAAAYQKLGFDVTTGAFNFDLEAAHPDVVHFLWPEELAGWK